MSEHDESTNGDGEVYAQPADHDFTGPLSPRVLRLIRIFFGLCALLLVADLVVDRSIHQPAERVPGFYAIYGFVGCVVLVLAAKVLRRVVMRIDSYYDPPRDGDGGDGGDDGDDGDDGGGPPR